jgi:hypothetical protein
MLKTAANTPSLKKRRGRRVVAPAENEMVLVGKQNLYVYLGNYESFKVSTQRERGLCARRKARTRRGAAANTHPIVRTYGSKNSIGDDGSTFSPALRFRPVCFIIA